MRATDVIRNVLDLIDSIDNKEPEIEVAPEVPEDDCVLQQVVDLLKADYSNMYDNSPDTHVQGIEAVTTAAGGGWNGRKNPADIRADSISMYPNYQHKPGE